MLKEMEWYEIFNFDGHFISIHSNDRGMINLSTYLNLLTTEKPRSSINHLQLKAS